MPYNLPVSDIVNVTVSLAATFPQRRGFGILNIIGASSRLPTAERTRSYSNMEAVAVDFSASDEEYKAASIFFAQTPRPVTLKISRRFVDDVAAELLGSDAYQADVDTWAAISNGNFKLNIDGTLETMGSLDFSAVTSLNGVASVISTALNAQSTGASCVFDGGRFVFRSGTEGASSTIGYVEAGTTGTNIAPLLAASSTNSGALATDGFDAEAIEDSLDALNDYDSDFYGLTLTNEATEQEIKDAAAWTEARVKIFGYTTRAGAVKQAGSTSDIGYYMFNKGYNRTFGVYDNDDYYAVISAFARGFVVNFNEQNSTLTLKFKQLPGITPTQLTSTERDALVAKKVNYYTRYGDSAMFAEGVMASGRYFDEQHGADAFQNAIETNVYGYLLTRTTKVPQTDRGVQLLVQQVERACEDFVTNGFLAPGVWNGFDLGLVKSGDFLPRGYYVFAQPVADQNQSDREARTAPPIQVIGKLAGAVHKANISVTLER